MLVSFDYFIIHKIMISFYCRNSVLRGHHISFEARLRGVAIPSQHPGRLQVPLLFHHPVASGQDAREQLRQARRYKLQKRCFQEDYKHLYFDRLRNFRSTF